MGERSEQKILRKIAHFQSSLANIWSDYSFTFFLNNIQCKLGSEKGGGGSKSATGGWGRTERKVSRKGEIRKLRERSAICSEKGGGVIERERRSDCRGGGGYETSTCFFQTGRSPPAQNYYQVCVFQKKNSKYSAQMRGLDANWQNYFMEVFGEFMYLYFSYIWYILFCT